MMVKLISIRFHKKLKTDNFIEGTLQYSKKIKVEGAPTNFIGKKDLRQVIIDRVILTLMPHVGLPITLGTPVQPIKRSPGLK